MGDINKKEIIYDSKTGECFSESTKTFKIYDDEKEQVLFRQNDGYVKTYTRGTKLSDVLTDMNMYARCHLLAENLQTSTNIIIVRKGRQRFRYATLEDISQMIGLSEKRTKKFIKDLIELQIVAVRREIVGDKDILYYLLNPLYFSTSSWLHVSLYQTFKSSLDNFISSTLRVRLSEYGGTCFDNLFERSDEVDE